MPTLATQVRIREAIGLDAPEIVRMLLALKAETIWAKAPSEPEPVQMVMMVLGMLETPEHHLLVAEEEERLVGLLGGQLATYPFLPACPYLLEWAYWVDPLYRGTSLAYRLWGHLRDWAIGQGAWAGFYCEPHGAYEERVRWEVWKE